MPPIPPDIDRLFTAGAHGTYPSGQIGTVEAHTPTSLLKLPTGRVVACDPFVYLAETRYAPFNVSVLPAEYRVELSVVRITEPGKDDSARPHLRVAAAKLVIREEPTVFWDLALSGDQNIADLGDDEFYGYGVDAGTGCFVDASALGKLGEYLSESEALMDAFNLTNFAADTHHVADPKTGDEVVAFSSGWGDGAYPTWIGRSVYGDVTCFVTDFHVLPDA